MTDDEIDAKCERVVHDMTLTQLCDDTDELLALLGLGAPPTQTEPHAWQPIETAPKDGTIIDLWRNGERLTGYRWKEQARNTGFFEGIPYGLSCVRDASHWMPLPVPPQETT